MNESNQTDRVIKIDTVFGKDVFILNKINGLESVSDIFEFDLSLHSENHDLQFDKIAGSPSVLSIRLDDGSERYINGIVSSFQYEGTFQIENGNSSSTFSYYRLKLVPWLWTLQLNRNCRIFQKKNVIDIISEVLSGHDIAKFDFRLTRKYSSREFCVQYRESDFNFISRLLEEEGIFYFFEHTKKFHTLVFSDDNLNIRPCELQANVNFITLSGKDQTRTTISEFKYFHELKSDSFELRDFNFKNPLFNIAPEIKGKKWKRYEVYDYPGEFENYSEGDKLVKIRYEEEQSKKDIIEIIGNGRGFQAGFRFELEEHPRADFNQIYSILSVEHQAEQSTYRTNTAEPFFYRSKLECVPYKTKFRPARKTAIPKIVGTQTAIVVGPEGEEIYTDEHGRVKVQFHWDRLGEKNENSSCWIRVSQPWAGTGFGGITIPRIGQEVIVDFLEGNPDCPIITGRVYNAEAKHPYDLPANKAHSGLMSRSTPGGGSANFNGIRMNDNSGSEMMEVQAEKNQQILVKNDKGEDVLNDETVNIGNNRTEQVFGNEVRTIAKDLMRTVLQNQIEIVALNRSKNIGLDDAKTVGLSQSVQVGVDRSVSVGVSETKQVGVDRNVSVGNDEVKQIGGNKTVVVAKDETKKIQGNKAIAVSGDEISAVEGDKATQVKGDIAIESMSGFFVKVGNSSIQIIPDGIHLMVGNSFIRIENSGVMVFGEVTVDIASTTSVALTSGEIKLN
jgi:type VI secretion system secreted protein VgrG